MLINILINYDKINKKLKFIITTFTINLWIIYLLHASIKTIILNRYESIFLFKIIKINIIFLKNRHDNI